MLIQRTTALCALLLMLAATASVGDARPNRGRLYELLRLTGELVDANSGSTNELNDEWRYPGWQCSSSAHNSWCATNCIQTYWAGWYDSTTFKWTRYGGHCGLSMGQCVCFRYRVPYNP